MLAELTWNTFRDHLILEYEIPKYDGDFGQPCVFVPLESDVCHRKVGYLMECFPSQHTKHWFQADTFLSLMRLRGMECNAPSGYAGPSIAASWCFELKFGHNNSFRAYGYADAKGLTVKKAAPINRPAVCRLRT